MFSSLELHGLKRRKHVPLPLYVCTLLIHQQETLHNVAGVAHVPH
ncbi:unnamed protein product [Schistosoma mattheei]|uniref:Uncharacterized protein n=1 Tax=Schistosoma mattheei TaxID=31246 RepID=A0A3P8CNA0_9TREM|nr:unnamed protein product [Schistosoma mattheei]